MSEITNYTKEVERALQNYYFAGEGAAIAPVFNAISLGYEYDMQLIVPVHSPRTADEVMSADEEYRYKELDPTDPKFKGQYFIPLFTSMREVHKGEETLVVNRGFRQMLDVLDVRQKCAGFVINPWGKNQMLLTRETLKMVIEHKPKSHLSFVKGSVLYMHAGAVVNAANESLLGGGGVDGAIHSAAGPQLLEACKELGGCKTGGAKVTSAYKFRNADYIIHAVGPVYTGEVNDANLLASCYMSALELAWKNHCLSVAFPIISTGAYGYPLEEAAKISITAALKWFELRKEAVLNVYFCCFREEELETYKKLIQR